MQVSREWIDADDQKQCEERLKQIRSLSSWCNQIDPDAAYLIDPMRFFRLAHVKRCPSESVAGQYASYHDFAWAFLRSFWFCFEPAISCLANVSVAMCPTTGPSRSNPKSSLK